MSNVGPISCVDLLEHRALPELANAVRSRVDKIMARWEESAREALPTADELTFVQLRDDSHTILLQLADALASTDSAATVALGERSRDHATIRFEEQYDLWELLVEYRVLRRIVIEEVHSALPRDLMVVEQIALQMGIDVMLHRGVMAFVEHQQFRLRAATEAESKYLAFISHDLRNNINGMTLTLELIKSRLAGMAGMEEDIADLNAVELSVFTTIAGMDRLLQTERLRREPQPQVAPVDLCVLASKVAQQFMAQAQQKGLRLEVQVPLDATVNSDGEWIRLVLQNLVGNAIKFSSKGSIRLQGEPLPKAGGWVLSVADEGPGIAGDQVHRLFEAFQRGDTHGQAGLGLGLAIASQAAKLLGGPLTVESKVGAGSTFRLVLPELKPGKAAESPPSPLGADSPNADRSPVSGHAAAEPGR